MNILLVYGAGGSATQFSLLNSFLDRREFRDVKLFIPELSGFEGRELPKQEYYFDLFLEDIYKVVEGKTTEPWIFYGIGSGASIILEFASRDWTFPNGYILRPQHTILNSPMGSLQLRRRKKSILMRNPLWRWATKGLLSAKFLQKRHERKLFQNSTELSQALRDSFFQDIKNCAAYGKIYEIFNPEWYENVRQKTWHQRLLFIWGGLDKSFSPKYYAAWQRDYPKSDFRMVDGWEKYPMLDSPEAFLRLITDKH